MLRASWLAPDARLGAPSIVLAFSRKEDDASARPAANPHFSSRGLREETAAAGCYVLTCSTTLVEWRSEPLAAVMVRV